MSGTSAPKKNKKPITTRLKRTQDISFTLSYDTACSLQAIITQQWTHAKRENSQGLIDELEQVNRFYIHLTDYVEKNS